jgi:hypothetical protein
MRELTIQVIILFLLFALDEYNNDIYFNSYVDKILSDLWNINVHYKWRKFIIRLYR